MRIPRYCQRRCSQFRAFSLAKRQIALRIPDSLPDATSVKIYELKDVVFVLLMLELS